MKKIIVTILATIIMLSGCASIWTYPYPATGNPGIDTALASKDYTHEEKLQILSKYRSWSKKPSITTNYQPVVDPAKCKNCNYQQDLDQCREIASTNTNYTGNTLTSAAGGAAIGAAFGAILGLDVGTMAGAGAAGGAIGGLGNEMLTVNQMIARCMMGRGYSVLR